MPPSLSLALLALAAPPDFARDVRPVFQQFCHQCHDGKKQTAGFRIDLRDRALKGGESEGAGVVPGKSAESQVYSRLVHSDPDLRMPPGDKRPTPEQVATVQAWIDAGATWPDDLAGDESGKLKHWAFAPPERPAVPVVGGATTAIDAFIRDRLAREKLSPSPEADRVTLLRRLSLDLTGLPPTPTEVDAFLADGRPAAYERQVDRLLASPHFGERWARLWLDGARYADSDGFEKDKPRAVAFYREWVIRAFNRDLPYNRFLTEQLAGDLLPSATQDQVVATGFLRNSMINEEGGVDPEQFRMEAMFDRIDAVGKSVLGLTIQCAQCHDHKYDPISQRDYYRVFAFLNNDHEANVAVYTPDEQARRAALFARLKMLEDEAKHQTPDWAARSAAWLAEQDRRVPEWAVVRPALDASGGQKHTLQADGSILAGGYAPTKWTSEFTVTLPPGVPVTAVRLELLTDANLPRGGPGRATDGMLGLTEFKLAARPNGGGWSDLKIKGATADANPADKALAPQYEDKSGRKNRVTGRVDYAIDGKDETAWGIDIGPGRSNVPRQAVFVLDKPLDRAKGAELTFKLTQNHGGWNSDDNQTMNLGRFRFAVTGAAGAAADPIPAAARQSAEERFRAWLRLAPENAERAKQVEALWATHPEGSTQLVLSKRDEMRPTALLKRGDFLKPGEAVSPGVPGVLNPLPGGADGTRLTFARWVTDAKAPTTARAWVNRVWQAVFGTGIVSTSEDLGTQCEPPSHPELLDWLAADFVESGWGVKRLIRGIVTSQTYRQASRVSPEILARDPYNRLLARGPRFRVDAEAVRDIALAASGLLDPAIGGRSVYPPLPAFMLLPPVSYGPKTWPEDKGPERYRRSLYVFRFRSIPYPVFQTFDAPNGDAACVRRPRSNTPLQALMTLNEPVFVEAARALALRAVREGGASDAARLAHAFRLCVARPPADAEARVLAGLLARQRERFAKPESKPLDVLGGPAPAGVAPAEAAAWTVVARVLLNLDETITKE